MKRIITTIKKEANKILLLTVLAGAMASCDSILDFEEGDCSIEYRVKFKYDYNMAGNGKGVDAFAQEVNRVALYAFDKNGVFVYQKSEEGEDRLSTGNYSMQVDIEPGNYELVTWAGLDDQSFAVPVLTPGVSTLEDLTVLTKRNIDATRAEDEEGKYIVKRNLPSLFHGRVEKQAFTRARQNVVTTISLVKNTNNIRIVIAQVNTNPGKPVARAINKDRFTYAIYDDNGYMNYDNTLLKDNLLTYLPFVTENSDIKSRALSSDQQTESEYPAAIAEISVARLLETQSPRLEIIDTEKGTNLLPDKYSLIDYLKLLKEQNFIDMPVSEYLDRESNFAMIFFVDENLTLMRTVVEINKWPVNINEFDF